MAVSAACRVLGTPKHLENILSQLDLEDDASFLFKLLSVNRSFNRTLLESPRLQNFMWKDIPYVPNMLRSPTHHRIKQNALLHYRPDLLEPFDLRDVSRIEVSLSDLRNRAGAVEECLDGLPITRAGPWRKMAVFKNLPCRIMIGLDDTSAPVSSYAAFGIIYLEPQETLGDLADKLQDSVQQNLLMGPDQRR